MFTVPLKGKLTVSTRNSILDSHPKFSRIEKRVSRLEFRFSRIENQVLMIEFRVSSFEALKEFFEDRELENKTIEMNN